MSTIKLGKVIESEPDEKEEKEKPKKKKSKKEKPEEEKEDEPSEGEVIETNSYTKTVKVFPQPCVNIYLMVFSMIQITHSMFQRLDYTVFQGKKIKKSVSFKLEPEIETYDNSQSKRVVKKVKKVVQIRRVRHPEICPS